MNAILKYSVLGILVAGFCVGMGILADATEDGRTSLACRTLDVSFGDSLKFVSAEDVKGYIDSRYGPYLGQQLDSVDLNRIEEILESQSAVLRSEAWVTDDGVLHVSITQRTPVVRFQNGGVGFYSDDHGFIFPLHPRYTADVPLVEGAIPLNVDNEYKGEAATAAERAWLKDMIGLIQYIGGSPRWKGRFGDCRVLENGDVVLNPVRGGEAFILGPIRNLDDKFDRIDKYYSYICARKGNYYSIVNIKYKGQIICRTKDM